MLAVPLQPPGGAKGDTTPKKGLAGLPLQVSPPSSAARVERRKGARGVVGESNPRLSPGPIGRSRPAPQGEASEIGTAGVATTRYHP
jgi:hypothetical protein